MCEICMPPTYRRNRAINSLARKEAQSLPASELLGNKNPEPFSEEEIIAEMNEIEFLQDCG